jgi:hypothetical protein
MKLNRYYFLAIIIVMLNVMFFSGSSTSFIENTSETKIEVSLEEQGSEEKLDEKLLLNIAALSLIDPKIYTLYDFMLPIVDRLYLNNIFKPPRFS